MAFENVISNGYSLKEKFWDGLHSNLEQKELYKNIYKIKNKDNECGNGNIYASVQYLDLYNSNTPFENECWALLGIIEEKSLLSFSKRVEKLVIISIAISLLIGLIGIYIASRLFTKPIVLLANKVRNSNPSKQVNLDKINISEIDELSSAIELLSANVADSSSKLSQIIEMVDMPIGAFELYKNAENVFCTKEFFIMFTTESKFEEYGYIEKNKFLKKLRGLDKYLQESYETENTYIYKFESKDKKLKWIRMNIFEDELKVLGVVVDVTKEFIEKKKAYIDHWNIEIALDDFGTGYNGDAVLLYIMPDYVKIDMSIVRGIDKDENRQKILKNLISYSNERNIKVIAEGVETKGEMETLINLGVDYMQGYYISKPSFIPEDISDKIKKELKICHENRNDVV
nr:EAL domain-containing protein [Clostridioides difficile]